MVCVRLLPLLCLRRLRGRRRHDQRLHQYKQQRVRNVPRADLCAQRLLGLRRVRLDGRVQHEQHAGGPDELRLQPACLQVEQREPGVRGSAGLRSRQHLLGDGLRAVLELCLVDVRGRQLPRLDVHLDGQHKLHALLVGRQLVRGWCKRLHTVHCLSAWPGPLGRLHSHG